MNVSVSDTIALSPVEFEQWSEVARLEVTLVLDGRPYAIEQVDWSVNGHGATDTLNVTIPLSTNPDFPIQLFRGDDLGPDTAAAANADVVVELWAGFPQNPTVGGPSIAQLTRQFLGEVDLYTGIFHDNKVTFACRSLGAHLVDDRLTAVSINQTIGSFLADIARKYSLPAPVVRLTPGAQPATIQEILAYGQVGGSNFAASLYGMHPMDLAIRGAQVDDTDVWVGAADGVINYVAPSLVQRGAPVDLKWGRDWVGLQLSHAPQASKGVEVHVHTVQPRTRIATTVRVVDDGEGNVTTTQTTREVTSQAILGTSSVMSTSLTHNVSGGTTASTTIGTSTGGAFNAKAGQGAGETKKQIYPLYVGNVSPQRAVAMGLAYRRQISQHEYATEGEVPITNRLLQTLSITSLLRIHGAPWESQNGTFYPREIRHRISVEEGWRAHVYALNHRLAQGAV